MYYGCYSCAPDIVNVPQVDKQTMGTRAEAPLDFSIWQYLADKVYGKMLICTQRCCIPADVIIHPGGAIICF